MTARRCLVAPVRTSRPAASVPPNATRNAGCFRLIPRRGGRCGSGCVGGEGWDGTGGGVVATSGAASIRERVRGSSPVKGSPAGAVTGGTGVDGVGTGAAGAAGAAGTASGVAGAFRPGRRSGFMAIRPPSRPAGTSGAARPPRRRPRQRPGWCLPSSRPSSWRLSWSGRSWRSQSWWPARPSSSRSSQPA